MEDEKLFAERQQMAKIMGGDRLAVMLTNTLWRHGVTTMEKFCKTSLMDIGDMRMMGGRSLERVREVRERFGVDEDAVDAASASERQPVDLPLPPLLPVTVPIEPLPPGLMDVHQAARCLGVEAEVLEQMRRTDSEFPPPAVTLPPGPAWKAHVIRRYRDRLRDRARIQQILNREK